MASAPSPALLPPPPPTNSSSSAAASFPIIVAYGSACSLLALAAFLAWRCVRRASVRSAAAADASFRPASYRLRSEHLSRAGHALAILALTFAWFAASVTLSLVNKFVYSIWKGGIKLPLFFSLTHLTVKGLLMFGVVFKCGLGRRALPRPGWRAMLTTFGPIGVRGRSGQWLGRWH